MSFFPIFIFFIFLISSFLPPVILDPVSGTVYRFNLKPSAAGYKVNAPSIIFPCVLETMARSSSCSVFLAQLTFSLPISGCPACPAKQKIFALRPALLGSFGTAPASFHGLKQRPGRRVHIPQTIFSIAFPPFIRSRVCTSPPIPPSSSYIQTARLDPSAMVMRTVSLPLPPSDQVLSRSHSSAHLHRFHNL